MGYAFCLAAIGSTFWMARKSLGLGLAAVLAWGYIYGILRANLASGSSYFVYDASVVTLYVTTFARARRLRSTKRTKALAAWLLVLALWPALLILLPYQPIEISLVGFRGCVFFLPAAILGSRLEEKDCMTVATAVAYLDIFVFIIAVAEYIWGIEAFFPRNAVTSIIYNSNDVAGYTAFRIPATFSTAAGYGGTLNLTLPFLYGAWTSRGPGASRRYRFVSGIAIFTVFVGVLLSASRMSFVILALSVLFAYGSRAISRNTKRTLLFLVLSASVLSATNARLQRFTLLRDTDSVEGRIHGSVNRSFWEVFFEYPLGNGLGGGGTSIPYFWEGNVRNPIALENDYARILLEQTVIGLLLWIAFLFWTFSSSTPFRRTPWREGRRLAWFICMVSFASSMIGIGLLTAVPGGFVTFLSIGWFSRSPETAQSWPSMMGRRQMLISPLRIREAT